VSIDPILISAITASLFKSLRGSGKLADAIGAHEMLAGTRPHKRGKIVLEIVA
jgi:hypothetical protein